MLNKIDMIPAEERRARIDDFVKRLAGRGRSAMPIERVFAISGLTHEGCEPLCLAVNEYLERIRADEAGADADVRFDRDMADVPASESAQVSAARAHEGDAGPRGDGGDVVRDGDDR